MAFNEAQYVNPGERAGGQVYHAESVWHVKEIYGLCWEPQQTRFGECWNQFLLHLSQWITGSFHQGHPCDKIELSVIEIIISLLSHRFNASPVKNMI